MDFGVQIEPQFGFEYEHISKIGRIGLENRFSTLWFSDHFMLDGDSTDRPLLDPWLVMTALVREFSDLRVGSLVFCNSYRNPALHAKMAATLDVLSGGRLEFGIGAGWKKLEYNAYGYDFSNDMTRIDQLSEAIQIIRSIWTEDKASFVGKHYKIKDLVSFPKPVQKPHPTIWVGTMYGKEHMLKLAAKYGDGINLAWAFTPEQLEKIFKQLDGYRKDFERSEEIKKSVGFWTYVFEDESDMETAIVEGAKKRNIPLDKYRERIASSMWGTPDVIVEKLNAYKDLGVIHSIFMFPHEEEIKQIEIFGKKVIPKLA
ncbi:MAG: LLM class flavin-dependent oxidoreductase [Candidatus Thorarchaeota archaeon]|nr:MAG: LLM class flavin-dependent oxidoreductase [Candidatus Thorarchaeota archaeon]